MVNSASQTADQTSAAVQQPALDAGLRNAYQWLAVLTMLLDHLGYLYDIAALRYVGRLSMPAYALLFAETMRTGHVRLHRLLILAIVSQPPVMYIFEDPKLNIIFGFAIFAFAASAAQQRRWFAAAAGLAMMFIPVAYGWYLYVSLAVFYWIGQPWAQRGLFAAATAGYVVFTHTHPRQLLAALVPFIRHIRTPRLNKYVYRYFYPGHLYILSVLNYFIIGSLTTPFINLRYSSEVFRCQQFIRWLLHIVYGQ
ncbi:MAG: hypothetical protein KBI46_11050 [Phycisphaerae bacterium]|nr:hypothetical protein [Phycisphaerae bacterium]